MANPHELFSGPECLFRRQRLLRHRLDALGAVGQRPPQRVARPCLAGTTFGVPVTIRVAHATSLPRNEPICRVPRVPSHRESSAAACSRRGGHKGLAKVGLAGLMLLWLVEGPGGWRHAGWPVSRRVRPRPSSTIDSRGLALFRPYSGGMATIEPFVLDVPAAVLEDLQDRLDRVVWPDQPDAGGWDYGTELAFLRRLVSHWRNHFDWRAAEQRLSSYPQFRTRIGEDLIHFVHVRGSGEHRLALVLSHGWPSRSPSSGRSSHCWPTTTTWSSRPCPGSAAHHQ